MRAFQPTASRYAGSGGRIVSGCEHLGCDRDGANLPRIAVVGDRGDFALAPPAAARGVRIPSRERRMLVNPAARMLLDFQMMPVAGMNMHLRAAAPHRAELGGE